jgi:hypothetical protein
MVLIGAGQGLAFAPMTASGVAGVEATYAGAASGMVNTVHQLGSALGLSILTAVAATAPRDAAARAAAALGGGSVLLALALVAVLVLVVPAHLARVRPSMT